MTNKDLVCLQELYESALNPLTDLRELINHCFDIIEKAEETLHNLNEVKKD